MSLVTASKQVKAFHEKMSVDFQQTFPERPMPEHDCQLRICSSTLSSTSARCLNAHKTIEQACEANEQGKGSELTKHYRHDYRFLRLHLILEETAELVDAMMTGNRIGVIDAICDLTYVLIGTMITFMWPFGALWNETHRSNMTKQPSASDPDKDRVRDKGASFEPPNYDHVLAETKYPEWSSDTQVCPHAHPYCEKCRVSPCPVGLDNIPGIDPVVDPDVREDHRG